MTRAKIAHKWIFKININDLESNQFCLVHIYIYMCDFKAAVRKWEMLAASKVKKNGSEK